MASNCPFCGHDPHHYVDTGLDYPVPVAVNCCEPMIDLCAGGKVAQQIIEFRRHPSPRKKARASRLMREVYGQ